MKPEDGIALSAIIHKIQTMADGGWRLTFDIPDSDTKQIHQLAAMRNCEVKVCVFMGSERKQSVDEYDAS